MKVPPTSATNRRTINATTNNTIVENKNLEGTNNKHATTSAATFPTSFIFNNKRFDSTYIAICKTFKITTNISKVTPPNITHDGKTVKTTTTIKMKPKNAINVVDIQLHPNMNVKYGMIQFAE